MSDDDVPETSGTDRRSLLKKLALGALGIGTLLSLKDVPKASAANTVGGLYSAIAGGDNNTTYDDFNFIGGGQLNKAGSNDANTGTATHATVGGGISNQASATAATVGGGGTNIASGGIATVSGGTSNMATGNAATVPGGNSNLAAGDCSFAAGYRARVGTTPGTHNGTFLFADSNDFNFNSAASNEFAVRCTGGARFVTAIDPSTGDPTTSMVIDPSGRLGVGTTSPVRAVHLQGNNACFRMDRDTNSSAFILVRTASGDFNTIWKTFYVGVDATAVNNGEFFIGDNGTAVSGVSTKRLWIDNTGGVHVPNLITGDMTMANNAKVTEQDDGFAFLNPEGEKIAVLDNEGNFHIKGDVIKDL